MRCLIQGVAFYESLLKRLPPRHNFTLADYLDPTRPPDQPRASRSVKLALVSCQRIMICLGDLARYREQANQTTSYGRARR